LFRLVGVKDIIAIPFTDLKNLGKINLDEIILNKIREKYEDKFIEKIGYIISIFNVKVSDYGILMARSDNIYTEVEFEMLTWYAKDREVVEAEVSDIKEFGAFLTIGPIEGLVHISQVCDDIVSYDKKGLRLLGKKTKRILEKHAMVRARIISVSYTPGSSSFKLAFTMRQPFLGKLEWINEDIKKIKGK